MDGCDVGGWWSEAEGSGGGRGSGGASGEVGERGECGVGDGGERHATRCNPFEQVEMHILRPHTPALGHTHKPNLA